MLRCCILIISSPGTRLSGEAKFRSIKHDLFLKVALLKMSYGLAHALAGVSLGKRWHFGEETPTILSQANQKVQL